MENKKENALNQFLGEIEPVKSEESSDNRKKVIDEREGLIERVDKILVTKDGRQLIREQY